ncbi:MAG: Holliday junction branch migration protein RuvA [Lentimicrobiaceae bacterium]|nr:Holliday junction branch migration protein RuvA [Lentimicrobiaceae bacterium]
MYAFIEGKVEAPGPTSTVINCSGVGYEILISVNTYTRIKDLGNCRLFTHLVVRDDAHILYGFATEDERAVFRQLISVSGVGAGTARLILSSLTPDEIANAILTGNVALLQRVKGIGGKTAQRIIVDLRDKIGKGAEFREILSGGHNTNRQEALSALTMLGFNKTAAEKAVEKVVRQEGATLSVEQLIKAALKIL